MSFKDIFNIDAEVKESAHATLNLIGEHTDFTCLLYTTPSQRD